MSESTERYEKMLDGDPRNTEAHNGIAGALVAQGRLEEARDRYLRVLTIDPRNTDAMNGLATMFLDQGPRLYGPGGGFTIEAEDWSLREAERWCRKVLSIDPDNLTAKDSLVAIARCQYELGRRIWSQEHDA